MTLPKPKQRAKDFRRYRLALGLTQSELAEIMGYADDKVISHKENGVRIAWPRDLLALECLLRRARKWPIK